MPRKNLKENTKKTKKATKTTSTRPASERSDYMPNKSHEARGEFFGSIYEGKHDVYYLETGAIKKDWKGRKKYCWRVMSKGQRNKDGTRRQEGVKPQQSVGSTRAYRLAMDWSLYANPGYWKHPEKVAQLKESIDKVLTKYGDHTCHRCGNNWCVNPRHLRIDTRVSNEVDKHYHYFLNHEDEAVRERFRASFPDLMKKYGVW